jgi:hypothetical protein
MVSKSGLEIKSWHRFTEQGKPYRLIKKHDYIRAVKHVVRHGTNNPKIMIDGTLISRLHSVAEIFEHRLRVYDARKSKKSGVSFTPNGVKSPLFKHFYAMGTCSAIAIDSTGYCAKVLPIATELITHALSSHTYPLTSPKNIGHTSMDIDYDAISGEEFPLFRNNRTILQHHDNMNPLLALLCGDKKLYDRYMELHNRQFYPDSKSKPRFEDHLFEKTELRPNKMYPLCIEDYHNGGWDSMHTYSEITPCTLVTYNPNVYLMEK